MNIAIVLASGRGERMIGYKELKCFIEVLSKPLFRFSLDTFLKNPSIDRLILTVPSGYINKAKSYLDENVLLKVDVIEGSATRQESVFKALNFIKDRYGEDNFVLIHDGARPLLSDDIINAHIKNGEKGLCSLTAKQNFDSLLKIENDLFVQSVPRDVYLEQTPASGPLKDFILAHNLALKTNFSATDDVVLLKNAGYDVHLILGNESNFKVTIPADLKKLERI